AEKPDALVLQDRAEIVLQRLDLLVVGRHAVPHQPVGARQPVEDVDAHLWILLDKALGGVDPARPGADDGDMPRGGTPSWRRSMVAPALHRARREGRGRAWRWADGVRCAPLPCVALRMVCDRSLTLRICGRRPFRNFLIASDRMGPCPCGPRGKSG